MSTARIRCLTEAVRGNFESFRPFSVKENDLLTQINAFRVGWRYVAVEGMGICQQPIKQR